MTTATAATVDKYFHATGAELREWSAVDSLATAELARRKANRQLKAASKAAPVA